LLSFLTNVWRLLRLGSLFPQSLNSRLYQFVHRQRRHRPARSIPSSDQAPELRPLVFLHNKETQNHFYENLQRHAQESGLRTFNEETFTSRTFYEDWKDLKPLVVLHQLEPHLRAVSLSGTHNAAPQSLIAHLQILLSSGFKILFFYHNQFSHDVSQREPIGVVEDWLFSHPQVLLGTISPKAREHLLLEIGVRRERIFDFHPDELLSSQIPGEWDSPKVEISSKVSLVIGIIGEFRSSKSISTLKTLVQRGGIPDSVHFLVAGHRVSSFGLPTSPRVTVLDKRLTRSQFAGLLRLCDAILIPNQKSNWSSGQIQAANSMGKPVIIDDEVIFTDQVEHQRNGLIYSARHEEDLLHKIACIAEVQKLEESKIWARFHSYRYEPEAGYSNGDLFLECASD
jgi:glycosyltransferase involved in cell wall biosynthesis